jgi:hypothetical protein
MSGANIYTVNIIVDKSSTPFSDQISGIEIRINKTRRVILLY